MQYDGFHKEKYNTKKRKWEKFDVALLDWAEKIIVYEEEHEAILRQYGYSYWGKSYNLEIPDLYFYNQTALVELVQQKLGQLNLL